MSEERLQRIEDMLKFLMKRVLLLEVAIRKGDLGISKGSIYGILKGMDPEDIGLLDDEIKISNSQIETVRNILQPIWNDHEKLKDFDDYNAIKEDAERHHIDKTILYDILQYLRGIGEYRELLDNLHIENPEDSSFSGY